MELSAIAAVPEPARHVCNRRAPLPDRIGGTRQAADDCYQETWLSALRAYPPLTATENLRAWVLTIAHRKAIDHYRSGRRAPEVPAAELPETAARSTPAPNAWQRTPIWPAVALLPPKQRMAVALRYALDADYPTVAAAMGDYRGRGAAAMFTRV